MSLVVIFLKGHKFKTQLKGGFFFTLYKMWIPIGGGGAKVLQTYAPSIFPQNNFIHV